MAESKVQRVARGVVKAHVNTAGMCDCGSPRVWAQNGSTGRMRIWCPACGKWTERKGRA